MDAIKVIAPGESLQSSIIVKGLRPSFKPHKKTRASGVGSIGRKDTEGSYQALKGNTYSLGYSETPRGSLKIKLQSQKKETQNLNVQE